VNDDITAYVGAVRGSLADLPDATRDELLEDLPEHLAEVKADGTGSLTDRLGTPEAYAAELRATAGFVGGFPDPPEDRFADLRATASRVAHDLDGRFGPLFGYERASQFLVLLRPAWWVLRGYLAAMAVAALLDDSGQPHGLLPRIGGSEVVAVLLLVAGILGSIWLGRRTTRGLQPWPRYALLAGTVFLGIAALSGFLSADSNARGSHYTDTNYTDPYSNVQDVFVYDQQGHLVEGARLFDQDGQPIRLGNPFCPDESTGTDTQIPADAPYPYCARNAPFRLPSAAPIGPSETPPSGLSPTPSAGPSVPASAPPTPSGPPSPTPSR
jgi:hypothetical protein